jgi:hypothetical protein
MIEFWSNILDYILVYKTEAVIILFGVVGGLVGSGFAKSGSEGVMTFYVQDSVSLIGGGFWSSASERQYFTSFRIGHEPL